jgi:hypothetical protein
MTGSTKKRGADEESILAASREKAFERGIVASREDALAMATCPTREAAVY